MERLPDYLQLIPYEEKFHDQLQDLEIISSQAVGKRFPYNLFQSCIHFEMDYATRAKLFNENLVMILKDTRKNTIVAGICIVTKIPQWIKVGEIFNLRVHEGYQRMGLGYKLCQFAEKECKKLNCEYIYINVYGNNFKMLNLAKKMRYCSVESLKTVVLFSNHQKVQTEEKVTFERIDVGKAVQYTTDYYKNSDFFPQEIEKIFESKMYKGTWMLQDEEQNQAGLSLWNKGQISKIQFTRILFPTDTLLTYDLTFPFAGLFIYFNLNEELWMKAIFFLVSSLLVYKFFLLTWLFFKYYAYDKVLSNEAKIFGYFYKGSKEKQNQLNNILIQHVSTNIQVKKLAATLNINVMHWDFDSRDQVFSALNESYGTFYVMKALNNEKALSKQLDENAFLDPRDFN